MEAINKDFLSYCFTTEQADLEGYSFSSVAWRYTSAGIDMGAYFGNIQNRHDFSATASEISIITSLNLSRVTFAGLISLFQFPCGPHDNFKSKFNSFFFFIIKLAKIAWSSY